MKLYPLILIATIILAHSCNTRPKPKSIETKTVPDAETLIRINQELVKNDIATNETYAKNKDWDYLITGTGIIYEILIHGSGVIGKAGDKVEFSYESKLLDGTFCYSSDSNGLKQFVVDYEDVESGLNGIAKLLTEGDSARIILPPHLAFGVAGDRNRIPPRSSLVYHLRLLKID